MKFIFIARINDFKLANPQSVFKFRDIEFSYNPLPILEKIDKKLNGIRRVVGEMHFKSLIEGPVCYEEYDMPNPPIPIPSSLMKSVIDNTIVWRLTKFHGRVNYFLSAFWLNIDHSASITEAFLLFKYADSVVALHSFINPILSSANGFAKCLTIDEEAFNVGIKRFEFIGQVCKYGTPNISENPDDLEQLKNQGNVLKTNYNAISRLGRAKLLLENAREVNWLPVKIAFYISVFECLFSAGGTEISHTVSERVAFYLFDKKPDKMDTYKVVREAYHIRSRFIHGDEMSRKHDKPESIEVISKKIDELLRITFIKIFENDHEIFNGNNDQVFQPFLKGLIFS